MLGSPIAHSLSPRLHRAAYAYLGLDWTYTAIEVIEAELAGFVGSLDASWRGLSLTMPLKRAAVEVATDLAAPVATLGVANTLVLDGSQRTAYNTDVSGMQAALIEAGAREVGQATILGGGSTAVAALAALAPLAATVVACVRSPQRSRAVAEAADRLGVPLTFAPWEEAAAHLGAPVVVSTAPPGATDELAGEVPPRSGLLLDVVYDPWPTALAEAWSHTSGPVLGGLDLLVHQAVGQVALMTGNDVPVAVLRRALSR